MITELLHEGGLSLDRLQSFCLVAQAHGITKAAQGDPVRQSMFSRQIKELEEFFGSELIRRTGRGIVLTDTGARLDTIARECFDSLLDFKRHCKDLPIEVAIGAGESVIQWLLLQRLDQIRERLPKVRLKFLNLPSEEMVKRLVEGLIDLAIVRKDAIVRPLRAKSVGVMRYALFLPDGRGASYVGKDAMKILNGLPLATLEGEGRFRSALAAGAVKQGIKLNIQVECSSFTDATRALAKAGLAAILPAIAAEDLEATGASQVEVPFLKSLDREMCLATNPRRLSMRPALEQVTTVLHQACRF